MKFLIKIFFLMAVILTFSSFIFAHSGDTLYVPYGTRPTIDGQISPGEWDDADSILTTALPEGPATIYYKQSPESLYFAINFIDSTYEDFDNASIYFDCDHNGGSAPQTDDYGFGSHRGGMFVEFVGTGSGWTGDPIDGWNGGIYSESSFWQVEYSISFTKLGIVQGVAKTLGFEARAGDLGNGQANWPSGASSGNPNTWADIASPDNWTSPDSIPPSVLVVDPNGGEELYVGTFYPIIWFASDSNGVDSVNIYYSTDAGGSWIVVSTGEVNDSVYLWTIPDTPSYSCLVRVIAFDPNLNSAQDESDSLFTIITMGIFENIPKTINSKKLYLYNFPEPFSNKSTIYFNLPEFTHINFAVYDISGKLVKWLYNGSMRAGQYSYTWDGKDERNSEVAPGVYFCRMVTSKKTLTRKITFVK